MSLIEEISCKLRDMNFEIAETCYDSLVKHGDLQYLKSLNELPKCESSIVLKHFPQLFVVHKTVTPKKGIFFVADAQSLSKEAKVVYEKYFPNQIVLIDMDTSGALQAKWLHRQDQFVPLVTFINQLIG